MGARVAELATRARHARRLWRDNHATLETCFLVQPLLRCSGMSDVRVPDSRAAREQNGGSTPAELAYQFLVQNRNAATHLPARQDPPGIVRSQLDTLAASLDLSPVIRLVGIEDPKLFHLALNVLARSRLAPELPTPDWESDLDRDHLVARAEGRFLEAERAKIMPLAAQAPEGPEQFVQWFDGLRETGPGQFDPLFDFLATRATREQMRWFIKQEVAGEAGFEDLVALTQVRMPERAKLELARNYWDEMGRGKPVAMHGPMLADLAKALAIDEIPDEELVWESLALSNALVGLAYNRRYAFHALGALGVIELTAPTRACRVADGLERVGLEGRALNYFRLHAAVDVAHWREWKAEIVLPMVREQPKVASLIAEGALMRLNAGARTFDRYRAEFGLPGPRASIG